MHTCWYLSLDLWLGLFQNQQKAPVVLSCSGVCLSRCISRTACKPDPTCCHLYSGCRVLLLCLPFEEAIRQVLLLGGDTDTNATVVGGLLGAYWGAAAIPDHMKAPLLARTAASPGQKRPSFLQTAQLPQLFDKLWAAANK